jgi:multiple sugar transport system ATP-binding protein
VAAITFDQVSKRFGDTVAVDALDLEVADGEFLVLVGPSGCGKTTALRMLAGLESVTDGRILIGDRVVNDLPPGERDIAMVFQSYALYPHMSVFDNLAFGLRNLKVGRDEIKHRVADVAAVLELEQLLDRKPRQLSGGQRQRVALGRSIVREPSVFLMDEPLSNLDAALRVQTRAEILKLQRRLGTTTIYVTHDQVEAMTMGDRIAVMRDGVLQQIGTPVTLYTEPVNTFVARFIGSPAMNLLPAPLLGLGTDGQLAGIRPEHVSVVMADDAGVAFEAQVEVVEYLGDEQLIHAVLRGHPLLVKLPVDVPVPSNGVASFTVAADKVRLFDATTGSALRASAAGVVPTAG